MKLPAIIILCLAVPLSGCALELPNLQWAPAEEMRQSAQIAADLAAPLSVMGTPPGSPAAMALASAARTQANYVGPPAEPIDLTALLDPATLKMWNIRTQQLAAHETRGRVDDVGEQYIAEKAAELAAVVVGETKVDAAEIIDKTQVIVDMAAMAKKLKAEIHVPADPTISEADKRIQEQLLTILDEVKASADAHAARPVTAEDVADEVEEVVDSTLDRAANLWDKYGDLLIAAGLPVAGVGGFFGFRSRRKRLAAEADKAEAEKGAAAADRKKEAAAEALVAAVTAAANGTVRSVPPQTP